MPLTRQKRKFLEAAEAFNFASYHDQFLTNDLYKSDKALPVRHDLLSFLFPDNFERAVSASGKEQILKDLIYLVNKGQISEFLGAGGYESQLVIDRAIFNSRSVLEFVHDRTNLDFYADPIDGSWEREVRFPWAQIVSCVTISKLQPTIGLLPCAIAC